MKVAVDPPYEPITEKPYCCVPAVLQMIHRRRRIEFLSQDEVGYQLGLIVPDHLRDRFDRVRTGPEPANGYGTRTSLPEFSVAAFLQRNGNYLHYAIDEVCTLPELSAKLVSYVQRGDDVAICYSSPMLFGDGDPEHVSLIQAYDAESGEVVVVDPAMGAPKFRATTVSALFGVLDSHQLGSLGGLWVFSARDHAAA